jgi:osmotically-inducible protein OsmY
MTWYSTPRTIPGASTQTLVAAARHPRYQPTSESVQRVKDLSLAAQVRAVLATDPATQAVSVKVTAQTGHVVLKGVVFSPSVLDTAAAVAQRVPGVTSLACEAEEIPPYPSPIM